MSTENEVSNKNKLKKHYLKTELIAITRRDKVTSSDDTQKSCYSETKNSHPF